MENEMRKLINKVKYFGKTLVNEGMETNEDETPRVITVKVTGSGKNKMNFYNEPSQIRMISDKNNSQMNSSYYYIGNTEFKVGVGANIYFAQYRHDIKEILVSYLVVNGKGDRVNGKGESVNGEGFGELVKSQYISPREMKGSIPNSSHKFDNGIKVGEVDHRGEFEITAVENF